MPRAWPRSALRALLPFAAHGVAREVDAALGVLLHTTLDLPGFVGEALGLLDPARLAGRVGAWTLTGLAVWTALALLRARRERLAFPDALAREAAGFGPLYLRPAVTLLAMLALAVQPTYPYGFTLPVALTQDWAGAQDALALAALVAWRAPALRPRAPNTASLLLLAFLAYALLTPSSARRWEGHPGNEPKTLRMAVALGHELSLDVEGVSAGMEQLTPAPLAGSLRRAAALLARESGLMLRALLAGPEVLGRDAIRATRINRQTIRGKHGGVYHVLAPGPSALLAPALRADRWLNIRWRTPGRLALSVLLWNALAAALVAALFLLLRDVTGRPGLSAAAAGAFGLLPPYLFYSFQFYPEMTGALILALALRDLLFVRRWSAARCWALGLLLALLPWQHQKFLPVWLLLALLALHGAVARLVTLSGLLGLLVPQAVTAYLTALYNFAVTGSVRPDALFLAWGPGGVSGERVGQGLLGLTLDARYGLLPYVPLYLLAAGGVLLRGEPARLLRRAALPVMLVYYVTVASADNWSGAVCNLGRYIMPATPLAIAFGALTLARAGGRSGVTCLALALAAWSALAARALWSDPHAANDATLLLAKGAFADGNAYLPNLFLRAWSDGTPGLAARVLAWLGLLALAGLWLRRAATGRGGDSPARAVAGVAGVVFAAGWLLEAWPAQRGAARFGNAVELGPGATAFFDGTARVEPSHVRAGTGEVELLVRSRAPARSLRLQLAGEGTLRAPGLSPISTDGTRVLSLDVPLVPLRALAGRRGVEEWLARARLEVRATEGLILYPLGLEGAP